jgi:hypothetical protein
MTDAIERLRAANPVSDCAEPDFHAVLSKLTHDPSLAVSTGRSARARRRAARYLNRRAAPALIAVVVALALTAAVTRTGGQLSLAARAYAATNPAGVVVHYVEITRVAPRPPHGESAHGHFLVGWTRREEVWRSGSSSRVVIVSAFDVNGRLHPIAMELIQKLSRLEAYAARTIFRVPRQASHALAPQCAANIACELLEGPDPVVTLHRLAAEGRLREAGRTRRDGRALVVMLDARDPQAKLRIYLDPNTGVPVEITQPVPGVSPLPMTTTILDYQRLALTAQSERLLAMRPHPRARKICTVAIRRGSRVSQHCRKP